MSKNAMAGAGTLCGVGLCMISEALLLQNGQEAHAAASSMPAAAATGGCITGSFTAIYFPTSM